MCVISDTRQSYHVLLLTMYRYTMCCVPYYAAKQEIVEDGDSVRLQPLIKVGCCMLKPPGCSDWRLAAAIDTHTTI